MTDIAVRTGRIGSTPSQAGRAPSRAPLVLQMVIFVLITVPIVAVFTSQSDVPFVTRAFAAILWGLCLVPSWRYVAQSAAAREPIPFVPVVGLIYGLYFALPVLAPQHTIWVKLAVDETTDYDWPILLALIGWVMLLLGTNAVPRRDVRRQDVAIAVVREIPVLWLVVIAIVGGALDVLPQVTTVPILFGSLLRFGAMAGRFSTCLLVVLALRHRLATPPKMLLIVLIVGTLAGQALTGLASNVAFYVALLSLTVWVERKRLRMSLIIPLAAGIFSTLALRSVMESYRREAWFGASTLSLVERLQLLSDLLQERYRVAGITGLVASGAETIAARSSALDLFADAVRRTPAEVPYWKGGSYISLAGVFIPRVIWPTKPQKRLGQDFGHRYSYLDHNDTHTSLNLPWLVEFYINFGTAGVIVGTLFVGVIFALLGSHLNAPGQPVEQSILGLVILTPMFNIESDFSLTFGGVVLTLAALKLIIHLFGVRFNRRRGAQAFVTRDASRGRRAMSHG